MRGEILQELRDLLPSHDLHVVVGRDIEVRCNIPCSAVAARDRQGQPWSLSPEGRLRGVCGTRSGTSEREKCAGDTKTPRFRGNTGVSPI